MTQVVAQNSHLSPAALGWSRLPAAYSIPDTAPTLDEAREYCARLARSHYENFSVASWFLPKRLRQHFFNVYAYCRISDDLGDEVGNTNASLQLLDQWERELKLAITDRRSIPYSSRWPKPFGNSISRNMN